jgi:hypothetical protein
MMTPEIPTDADIERTAAEYWDAEGEGVHDTYDALQIALRLIDDGWQEGREIATFRVGVVSFGWEWPDDDVDVEAAMREEIEEASRA